MKYRNRPNCFIGVTVMSIVLVFGTETAWSQANMDAEWKPELTEAWEPVPPVVTPGDNMNPPSDAVILFD